MPLTEAGLNTDITVKKTFSATSKERRIQAERGRSFRVNENTF